jgi:uncharacterized RDD family membrane protein YckC
MYWYWVENNAQQGPVGDGELQAMAAAGRIGPDTLVWRDGFASWIPWREAAAKPAPPPPAAPLPADGETCTQCGRAFPKDDLMRFENERVCAACKPLYLQRLKEGVPQTGTMVYGGFWERFGAKVVDGLILSIPYFVVFFLLAPSAAASPRNSGAQIGLTCLLQFGYNALAAAYTTWFVGRFGATPGKRVAKLKIVRADGSRVTYGRAFGRYFAELLSSLTLGIGYIIAAFDDEKRALHDRICDTRVVHI